MAENPAFIDAELELAIEHSRQTFREEEQRRRRATTEGHEPDTDLIRFDNPEDAERKRKNDQICRLFSHPGDSSHQNPNNGAPINPIGWRPNLGIAHTNSSTFQVPPTSPSTSVQVFNYPASTIGLPTTQLGHSYSATSLRYPQHSHSQAHFPHSSHPIPSHPPPPPPSATSHSSSPFLIAAGGFSPRFPISPSALTHSASITPPPRPPKPIHFRKQTSGSSDAPPELPPRLNRPPPRPRHSSESHITFGATDTPNILSPNQGELSFSQMPVSSTSQPPSAPHNAYAYVPFASTSSYDHLLNGDLIDLNDDSNDGNKEWTLDEIRREFDPLYLPLRKRPTSEASMPPEQLQENRNVENYVSSPVIQKIKSPSTDASEQTADRTSKEGKENAQLRRQVKITDIRLHKVVPAIFEQVKSISHRQFCPHEPSPSCFVAPTADYMTTRADTVKVLVFKDHTWKSTDKSSRALICNIHQEIEALTYEALLQFLSDDEFDGVNPEDYGLKMYGFNEFLSRTSTLGQNIYTGFCLLYGQDVKLEIGKINYESKPNLENGLPEWERMKSQIKYSSVIDKEDIENALCNLSQKMDDYEAAFGTGNTLEISKTTSHAKQSLKLICKLLNGIVPEKLYLQMQKYLAATTEDQLYSHREDFIMELRSFISTYCKCTVSSWAVEQVQSKSLDKMEVLACKDSLRIMLNSIHNIPEHWAREYADFSVSVDIYHGTQILDGHQNKIARSIDRRMFFPIIPLDLYAVFNRMQICQCPKETKLVISISGRQNSPANLPQQGVSGQGVNGVVYGAQPDKLLLAYVSISLFDHERNIRQGVYYLPLTKLKGPLVKPFGPYPYIKDAADPVLVVTFKSWDKIIYFPEVQLEYQSVSQDFAKLDIETQEYIIELIEQADTTRLQTDDKEMLWQKRAYLMHQPEALPLVLASVSDWSYPFLSQVYQILDEWAPLKPELAMQLLLPQFADERIRERAIKWIAAGSTEFLFNSIPQFVEAVRFEHNSDCALSDFLFELSQLNLDFTFEIYWQLQQRIDHCASSDRAYAIRCQMLQQDLIDRHPIDHLRFDVYMQHALLNELDRIQDVVRRVDDLGRKVRLLQDEMELLDANLLQQKVKLPIHPSFDCCGIRVQSCSVFNSNAKPLKIVFRGLDKDYHIIHKKDDDMRQDAFVLMMVNEMVRIWKANDLDLKVVTFRVMPVGYKKGMGELVLNCATLLEIQKDEGFTGVIKDEALQKWIEKYNTSEFTYKEAINNFTRSCAAWCVITYALGIGDRHNDNILVTTKGHVFHIDFGKYMGDWQMAAGFRRDRVPFVFTSEMFFVINGGPRATESYQMFIDYCCKAFNCLRRNRTNLTNLLRIMACSDVPGINMDSLAFVEKNLMLDLSETNATMQFTEMIQSSLKSMSTRLNFVAHTFAQFLSSSSSFTKKDSNRLTFIPQLYTVQSDGKIKDVRVRGFEKRTNPNKVYLYKIEVVRENVSVPNFIYRSFAEFEELHEKLRKRFPMMQLAAPSGGSRMRSNVKAAANKRMFDIEFYLRSLFKQPNEICQCDLVYTFFHSILRDNKNESLTEDEDMDRSQCQVHLRISHNSQQQRLDVFVGHVKNLAILPTGASPDPYVKVYLRPDQQNFSKRKTNVVKSSQNPTFNQELSYDHFPAELLSTRVLEVSVWNSGGLMDNHKMYMVYIPLTRLSALPDDRKGIRVIEKWYPCEKNI